MAVPKLSDDELATLREKCKVIAEENKGVNHEKKKKKLLAEQRGDTSLRAGEGEQFIFRVMLDHSIVNISSGEFSARNDNEAAQEELSRQRLVERSKVWRDSFLKWTLDTSIAFYSSISCLNLLCIRSFHDRCT